MSPEQLKTLQHLTHLFEAGCAGHEQIKQLSMLLAEINHQTDLSEDLFAKISFEQT
ncbi:hypothetical protein SAMN05216262_11486 [Colwellia chukchiensis]|uniref:Uncharacterized protein n=1 Tax=Colwellia chukchiensis TaxID=641665 RepID=A0A1H7RFW1_9GAMM|nr:hypothetical protein [Colwellia chukchiensis]SEL59052.1 hypothetical protein SAMN05216262_11486 [Colwellia chukchiensis]